MHFFLHFFLITFLLAQTSPLPTLDLTNPPTIQLRNTSPSQPLILLVTSESIKKGNFFQFTQNKAQFPYFIRIYDFSTTARNLSFPVDPQVSFLTSDDCIYAHNYLNCTDSTSNPTCDCFKTSSSPSDCLDSLQLKKHCTDDITYLDVELIVSEVQPNELALASPGSLTFHYLQIIPIEQTTWLVTLSQQGFWNYPTSNQIFESSQSFLATSDSDMQSQLQVNGEYRTMFKTRLVKHSYQSDIYCRYSLRYNGIIRGIYINDYPSGSHSNPQSLDTVNSAESSIRFLLKAKGYNIVTVIGLGIETTDMQFIDCSLTIDGNTIVQANFDYFYYNDSGNPEDVYTSTIASTTCASNCERCVNNDLCIQCKEGSLHQGKCVDRCPAVALYPSSNGVCTSTFETTNTLKQSMFTDAGVTIQDLLDQPDNDYLMICHGASDVQFGNSPLVVINNVYSLAESIPNIVNITNGSHSSDIAFNSIADSNILNSDQVSVVYYPIESSSLDINVYTWNNTTSEPEDIDTKLNPTSVTTTSSRSQNYLVSTSFYIFELVLDCTLQCQLGIISDGKVTVVRNDRTVLLDMDFITKWQYTYAQPITGLGHYIFKVSAATYFQLNIDGQDYQTYRKDYPIAEFTLSGLSKDINTCNIPNCNNCEGEICLSCNEGFFLDQQGSSCSQECSTGNKFLPERVCFASCGDSTVDSLIGSCYPICNEPGMFYSEDGGCKVCVDGCSVCSSATTCDTCLYESPLNTNTTCHRKSGSIYTTPDFTISQTLTLLAQEAQDYAVIIADASVYENKGLYFTDIQGRLPRIFGVYKMLFTTGNDFQVNLPALRISDTRNISLHYIKLEADINTSYSLTGFYDNIYADWPQYDEGQRLNSNNGVFQYESFDGLVGKIDDYRTVIAQKIYTHDLQETIICNARIAYRGNIRGMYVNSELTFIESVPDNSQKESVTQGITFDANSHVLVTFTGYRFQIISFSFEQCVDTQNQPVTPTFTSFLLGEAEAVSDTFSVTNNTYCDGDCLRCINSTYCLRCAPGMYLQNGNCLDQCDSTQYNSLFGVCDTVFRSQGLQLQLPFYQSNKSIIIASYGLALGDSAEILAIAFPFQPSFGKFSSIVRSIDEFSLAEASFLVISYQKDKSQVDLSLPVKPSAQETLLEAYFALYTIKRNFLLLAVWSQENSAIINDLNPDSTEFIASANTSYELVNSNTYYLSFFVDCVGACQIQFSGEGFVNIQANYRTFLFQASLDSTSQSYQLQRAISSITFLEIYVWDSTHFDFQIKGKYSIFTYDQLILTDKTVILPTTSCPPECLNCYKGNCLSCVEGLSLTSATKTCGYCTNSDVTLPEERRCIAPTTCQTSDFFVNDDNNTCQRQCTNPGFFYSPTNGCTNPCDSDCQFCYGPANNQCLACYSPRVLNNQTNTCDCPIGTVVNATGDCVSVSFIMILGDQLAQSCTDYKLEAVIRRDELLAYDIQFQWELDSTTAGGNTLRAINNYLATQTDRIVFIPERFMKTNNKYRFIGSYQNVLGQTLQDYIDTKTIADFIPNVNIDGGLNQTLLSSQPNQITALVTYSQCLNLSQPLRVNWSISSGEPFDINGLYNPQAPLKLSIPKCTLKPGSNTSIMFQAWVDKFIGLLQTQIINITVPIEEFNINIENGKREHPRDLSLTLKGVVVGETSCIDQAPIQYSWSCFKVVVLNNDADSMDNTIDEETDEDSDVDEDSDTDTDVVSTLAVLNGANDVMDTINSNNFADFTSAVKFVTCPDPNQLFNQQSLDSDLIIPKNYFQVGNVLRFRLTAVKGLSQSTAKTEIIIENPTELSLQIVCQDCQKYSNNLEYNYQGGLASTTIDDPTLEYTWNIDPPLPFITYNNLMKILANSQQLDSSIDFIKITLTVQSSNYHGMSLSLLPVNTPPSGGDIVVFPTSGYSLTTYFSIVAENWDDEDLPLTYQFNYYFEDSLDSPTELTDQQLTSQTTTYLPGKYLSTNIILEVIVQDLYGAVSVAQTSVQVECNTVSLENSVNNAQGILDSLEDYNPFEKLKVITVLNDEVTHWEDHMSNAVDAPVCTDCSGHGYCDLTMNRCICDDGWALADCSLDNAKHQTMMDFKINSLHEVKDSSAYYTMTKTCKHMIYNTLKISSGNGVFNTNDTLMVVQDVLESSLHITDDGESLSDDDVNSVSEILSNMMSYSSVYDCAGLTNFTNQLRDKTNIYLDLVSQNSLASTLVGENGTVINTENFNLLTQKVRLCDLDDIVFSAGGSAPNLTFKLTPEQQQNCSYQVNLQYYAFSQGLIDCSAGLPGTDNEDKTHLAIQFSDPDTGDQVDLGVGVQIDYLSSNQRCPSKCNANQNGQCICEDLSPFDVKSQILRIFTLSQIEGLLQISALLSFAFWETAAFWGTVLLTIWFFVTMYLVKYKWAKLDVIEQFNLQQKKRKWDALVASFKATHPMLNVYYYYNEDFPKTTRAILYYSRVILILAFTSVFSGTGVSDDFLFQLLDLNLYLIILPYFTIIPITGLVTYLIQDPPQKDIQSLPKFRKRLLIYKNRFGSIVMAITLLGSLLGIFILAANQSDEERLGWTSDFIQSMIQDLILTPLVFLCIQYSYMRMLESNYIQKKSGFKNLLMKQVNPALWMLREQNNTNSTIPVNKIAPETTRTSSDFSRLDSETMFSSTNSTPKKQSQTPKKSTEINGIGNAVNACNVTPGPKGEVNPILGHLENVIKEESVEESPCYDYGSRARNRIAYIRHGKSIFKEERPSRPSIPSQANHFNQNMKRSVLETPSIQGDLEVTNVDTSIDRHIAASRNNTSLDNKVVVDSEKSLKPSSWHNEMMDSALLSSLTKLRDSSSLNALRGLESPSTNLLKCSPTTGSARSRVDSLHQSKVMRALRQNTTLDVKEPIGENNSGFQRKNIMYVKSKTLVHKRESVIDNASSVTVKEVPVISETKDVDFEFINSRRARMLAGKNGEGGNEVDVWSLDDLTKKLDMEAAVEENIERGRMSTLRGEVKKNIGRKFSQVIE